MNLLLLPIKFRQSFKRVLGKYFNKINIFSHLCSLCKQLLTMNWILRKLKDQDEAEQTSKYLKNGGILLERLIESSKGKYYQFRCFSFKEIKAATHHFIKENPVNVGGLRLHKGYLCDRLVCIRKHYSSESFFNDMVFAAQIRHKNVLKLIGCCLEREIPLLVFESFPEGSLIDHIGSSKKSDYEPLLWTERLKIAIEIADMVAYLHFGFSRPIVFRDVQPNSILIDEEGNAKLFGFDLCISIPEDKTYVQDNRIAGSIGYMAPEYCWEGYFNEKYDVHSFGMLLLFLLTGSSPSQLNSKFECDVCPQIASRYMPDVDDIYDDACERGSCSRCSMLKHVEKSVENNRLEAIVDPIIVRDGLSQEKMKQLGKFANLAIKCCSNSPMNRPTMIGVTKELKKLLQTLSLQ